MKHSSYRASTTAAAWPKGIQVRQRAAGRAVVSGRSRTIFSGPAVRNYEHPDPACPLKIVRDRPLTTALPAALCLTWMPFGQAAAVVLAR